MGGLNRLTAIAVLALGMLSPAQAGWLDWLGMGDAPRTLTDIEQAKWTLYNTDPCCGDLSQLSYLPLSNNFNQELFLDIDAQVFEFKSGKSFVLAYQLPSSIGPYSVTLYSDLVKEVIFAPSVLILDDNFQPTRAFSSKSFKYTPARMLEPDNLNLTFNFNGFPEGTPGAERYMVIFTTEADLTGFTQLTHPLRVFAQTQSRADPGVEDPIAKHTPVGKLRLGVYSGFTSVDGKDTVDRFFTDMFGSGGDAQAEQFVDLPLPDQVPDRSPTPGVTQDVVSGRVTMLSETEELYNQLILQSVAENDIDKALRLVEEAERAGSRSARNTFIERVKELK